MRDLPTSIILNRPEAVYPTPPLKKYSIVTGSEGSLGRSVCAHLRSLGQEVIPVDKVTGFDLKYRVAVRDLIWMHAHDLTAIFHLAAAKDGPAGEDYPYEFAHVNLETTYNVLAGAADVNAKVVFASTGKAGSPETAYGASKLICERMVLNAGGVAGRFYNVAESGDNVFRYWLEQAKECGRIYVCDAYRYFISLNEATTYIVGLAGAPTGRYAPHSGESHSLVRLAHKWATFNGGVEVVEIPLRRGDRHTEPLCGIAEEIEESTSFGRRITSNSDPRPIPRKGEEDVPGNLHYPEKFRRTDLGFQTQVNHEALYG